MIDNDKDTTHQKKIERLRLPFEKRKQDIGAWSYDHRFGLCVTVIAVLMMAIVFVSAKIRIGSDPMAGVLVVDINDLKQLLEEEQRKNEELKQAMEDFTDYGQVRNIASNENAELNDRLRDDRGTNASQLYDEAQRAQERLNASRQRYEDGLQDNDKALAANINDKLTKESTSQASKVKGSVMVSFSLVSPIRYERRLVTPAYMCQGGGTVVVRIVVSRSGNVLSASVDKSRSTSDNCMTSAAVEAATSSRFNLDDTAPDRQQGIITYIFIPQ